MDHTEAAAQPVGTIGARTKRVRGRRGWTAAELGKRMARLGIEWDRSIVANLENERRKSVSVGELLALSIALDVAPVHLLVPPEGGRYQPAPSVEYDADTVRAWVRGERPLPGTDLRIFRTEAPEDEWRDPTLPEQAQAENEVARHLVAGIEQARRAGLSEEQVVDWVRRTWRLSETLAKGNADGE